MEQPRTLVEKLRLRARQQPDGIALTGEGSSRVWAELDARTDGVARAIRRSGVRKGDRVALLSKNSMEWIEAFLGILKAGAVAAPVNHWLTQAECDLLLDSVAPRVLILSNELFGMTTFQGPVLALGSGCQNHEGTGSLEDPLSDEVEVDDLAVIASTSGTTGRPKGVMWSHRALLASAECTPFPPRVARETRVLLCAPLFTAGAIVMACNALAIGATLVIARFDATEVLRSLAHERIEFIGLAPTMIALLLDAAPVGWRAPALRRIFYGAGPMKPELFVRAKRLFGCEFQQAYGMSETCTFGTRLDPGDHSVEVPERITSAGKPMPGVMLRLVDEGGAEVACGAPGEILMRTPATMLGYWQQHEETVRALAGGWYHTGDIGYCDPDGYVYIVDRKDDMVKSGGLSVSPLEVEGVLLRHPAVEEAVVVGVPDDRWGQKVTAVVRARTGEAVTESDLIVYCRSRLASYKVPRAIVYAETPFPRNALGKISRRAVRERYGAMPRK